MRIRAVAVDIDGTVTDMAKRLIWPGVEALRRVEAQNIPVITATGNVFPVTKAFASFVGLSGPLVCENGGVVYSHDGATRRLLHRRDQGDEAFRFLRRQGVEVRKLWSDAWRESEVALELGADEAEIRRQLDGWGLDVVATRFAIHLMEPGLNKMAGLEAALEMLPGKIAPADVLAIGDSRNDVEMLRGCGASAVVGNGVREAMDAADFVADGTFGHGVAEALDHYGLGDPVATPEAIRNR